MQYGGVVYNEKGQPFPGVKLQVYDPVSGLPVGASLLTGAQGSWQMDLTSGKFIIYFYAPGYLSYGIAAEKAAELTMKPGAGYDPQPGELLPVTKSDKVSVDWKFWILLALGLYGITRK